MAERKGQESKDPKGLDPKGIAPTDVLQNILIAQEDTPGPAVDELNRIIHRSFNMGRAETEASALAHEERDDSESEDDSTRTKSTIYLVERVDMELNHAKQTIRDMMPQDARTGISRSAIANIALSVVLRDFEMKGEKSVLMKQIRKGARSSQ